MLSTSCTSRVRDYLNINGNWLFRACIQILARSYTITLGNVSGAIEWIVANKNKNIWKHFHDLYFIFIGPAAVLFDEFRMGRPT